MPEVNGSADSRRWLILAVIGIAQLMVVLDKTYPGANTDESLPDMRQPR
jgi:hypothetical protein